jgi:hypothetical protein
MFFRRGFNIRTIEPRGSLRSRRSRACLMTIVDLVVRARAQGKICGRGNHSESTAADLNPGLRSRRARPMQLLTPCFKSVFDNNGWPQKTFHSRRRNRRAHHALVTDPRLVRIVGIPGPTVSAPPGITMPQFILRVKSEIDKECRAGRSEGKASTVVAAALTTIVLAAARNNTPFISPL